MKKATSLILALVVCLSLCACGSNNKPISSTEATENAETTIGSTTESKPAYTEELTFEPSADLQSYVVTGLNGIPSDTNIVIPDTFNGYPVSAIGRDAFYEVTGITSIVIPNTITTIASGAFEGCSNLTSIVLPESITTLGLRAFVRCGFTSISIPDGITILEEYLFAGCANLSSITIPESVITIDYDVFYGITNLTICGKSGSYAEAYAKENNIPFVAQ